MGLISFNDVGDLITQNLTIQLSDTAGVGTFTITDGETFPIFRVSSDGDTKIKGRLRKI